MQAEHIPVHLGSMPDAVAAVLGEEQRPGVAWILNDPYRGGTHLPDVTLISPVFVAGELLGFAASRAHHADIGGPTPGGMPAFSRTLDEEGVVIPPTRAEDAELERLAGQMRAPRQRLADLRAQQAANRVGELRLAELAERHGADAAARRDGRDPRLRRAPHPGGAGRAPRRHLHAPRTCSRTTARARERDVILRVDGDDRRRAPAARLQRHRPAGRRQPQLPALGDQVGGLLRGPRPDRPRRAALGRRPPPDRGGRPAGLPAQRPLPRRRRRRQRRDLQPGRRPGASPPSAAPARSPPRARGR